MVAGKASTKDQMPRAEKSDDGSDREILTSRYQGSLWKRAVSME